jgi:Flp pilus assembly protein TadD
MFVQEAESRFQQGLKQLARGRAREALPFISAAMEVHQENDRWGKEHATYLSYKGLCQCLTRSGVHAGLQGCRRATELDPWNPDIWWNLGRVSLIVGRRAHAHHALLEGIRLQPGHPGILRDLRRMGIRRIPPMPFLTRSHPVNILLGRIGSLFRLPASRRGPTPVSTPSR